MNRQVSSLRSSDCLYGFRCGLKEIDTFCKSAFIEHTKEQPTARVRVLYDADKAVGMYTLSMYQPDEYGGLLDKMSVYSGKSIFLYIDHLAIRNDRHGDKLSTELMVDLLEIAHSTLDCFGRVFAVGLHAADDEAIAFFKYWGFEQASESTSPFMFLDRPSLAVLWQQIEASSKADF